MRITISITMLGLCSLAATANAQQVPPALLPPTTAQVPDALIPPATNLLTHTLAATNAEAAWEELQTASHRPEPPAQWQAKEPSEKEMADFFMPYALALMDKSKDFYTRFPKDSHALAARKQEMEITGVAVSLGATNQLARLDAAEKIVLADPGLSEDDRLSIRQSDIERAAQAKESEGEGAVTAELEKGVRTLQKEFPKRPEIIQMLLEIADDVEGEKARVMLQEITNSPVASDEMKQSAAGELKKLDFVGKPIDLHFTALDGREVDVSKMKGKVVLIDFWATWCAPCVGEVPQVKEAYDKNHPKGFEIVGVSLDQEKASLTEFVAGHKMDWPQYFETQGGENKFAGQFGITSIPAMWLVDKKGNLRDLHARSDLSGKVEKLLAE
jgi:thiol-disulfide isomerase/thioredoxin